VLVETPVAPLCCSYTPHIHPPFRPRSLQLGPATPSLDALPCDCLRVAVGAEDATGISAFGFHPGSRQVLKNTGRIGWRWRMTGLAVLIGVRMRDVLTWPNDSPGSSSPKMSFAAGGALFSLTGHFLIFAICALRGYGYAHAHAHGRPTTTSDGRPRGLRKPESAIYFFGSGLHRGGLGAAAGGGGRGLGLGGQHKRRWPVAHGEWLVQA
jgi:hypothetical protein